MRMYTKENETTKEISKFYKKPNPVAKFAHHFNKSQVFSNKRKHQRHDKHGSYKAIYYDHS